MTYNINSLIKAVLICALALIAVISAQAQTETIVKKTNPAFDTLFFNESEMNVWYQANGIALSPATDAVKKDSLIVVKGKTGTSNPLSRTIKRGGHFSPEKASGHASYFSKTQINGDNDAKEHFSLSHFSAFKPRKFFLHHSKSDLAGGKVHLNKITKDEDVQIVVKDIFGNVLLNNVFQEYHDISQYEITLNRKNLPNGIFFVSILKGNETETQSLLIHHFPEHIK